MRRSSLSRMVRCSVASTSLSSPPPNPPQLSTRFGRELLALLHHPPLATPHFFPADLAHRSRIAANRLSPQLLHLPCLAMALQEERSAWPLSRRAVSSESLFPGTSFPVRCLFLSLPAVVGRTEQDRNRLLMMLRSVQSSGRSRSRGFAKVKSAMLCANERLRKALWSLVQRSPPSPCIF